MSISELPLEFSALAQTAVSAIRRAYEINAERYDPDIGDDAMVFGVNVYRNSWFLLEQEVELLDDWASARPQGSLVLSGLGMRLHVYRFGTDADVDLEAFRLDDARASQTKRAIAVVNNLQLQFGLEVPSDDSESASDCESADFPELVVVHAGNPDDGCCGVWVGAPIAPEEITSSPWAWIEPLWTTALLGGETGVVGSERGRAAVRHDELPEPEISLEPIIDDVPGAASHE